MKPIPSTTELLATLTQPRKPVFRSVQNQTALLLFSIAVLVVGGAMSVSGQSALDGFDPNANGVVQSIVVQPDGKVLIAGNFTTVSPNGGAAVTRNRIARLNPDGTLDTAFNPNADNNIFAIALQSDGKILVAGFFSSVGGQTRNHIARLDPITGAADSFDPNADLIVESIAIQADGKILAGGAFTAIGGESRNRMARLDATTGMADSFDPNSNAEVVAIAVQKDGKILVAGAFSGPNSIGGQTRNGIARLDPITGTADLFNPNANGNINTIAIQADGKILAGGFFTNIGGQPRIRIARLDATIGLADSFNPSANGPVNAIAVQADGKILAGGAFTSVGGQARNRIARLDATTGLADSLDSNASNSVIAIALQADGKILAGGGFTALAPLGGATVTRNRIARLEIDGRIDQTLNPTINGSIQATALQADGKILIGGNFTTISGVSRANLARLNTDGTLDTAFNPFTNNIVRAIAVQADGKIIVGGFFTTIGGQTRNRIARLDPTTGSVDSFDPDANNGVTSIAVQNDGKILAGGNFTGIGGQTRNRIARIDPTTGSADSFDPNANGGVNTIAIQADGKILVGGTFAGDFSIGLQTRNRIARLDATTGLADSFNPTSNGLVTAIALQADGKVLVGGGFSNIGTQTRNRIARLDAATGLADSFNPNANNEVDSIAIQADGKILVAGLFSGPNSIGGQTRNSIARLDATGLADAFNPEVSTFGLVVSLTVQPDGKIIASGSFDLIGGQPRDSFARLSNDTPAGQNLSATQTAITWTRAGASPQFSRVTFESSNDNVNYALLGNGTAAGSNWVLTGLNLPTRQNLFIRARGFYRGSATNGSESITESVRNIFVNPSILGNISTRLRVETGDNVLIGGFIVTGTQPKKVLVRAMGPSLPISGALADPVLELRASSGALIRLDDNWRTGGQEAEIIATTIPPGNDFESAIVATLPGNNSAYTATVRGVNNGTGIGVVEVYDLDSAADSKLANISTRGFVQTNDDVLIGGLIVLGQDPLRVIVRAIGPSLPVPGSLANPTLELHDDDGALIASNDDWRSDQEAEIIATGIPPSSDLESALVQDFAPGNYTAIVRGVNSATGIALIEAYNLN